MTLELRQRVIEQFQSIVDRREPAMSRWPGILGMNNDGGSAQISPNQCYVRIGNDEMLTTAFNNRTSMRNGLPVIVGYDPAQPTLFQVLAVRQVYEGEDAAGGATANHHKQHEWGRSDGGEDVVWIRMRQLTDFLVYPTMPATLELKVKDGVYFIGTTAYALEATTVDLTSSVPGSGMRWVLVALDETGVYTVDGTASGSVSYSDIPDATDPTHYKLAAILVKAGDTALTDWPDDVRIIDLRLAGSRLPVTNGLGDLTAAEIDQLENINAVTISNAQWGYLGAMDQGLATGDTVAFAGITVGNMGLHILDTGGNHDLIIAPYEDLSDDHVLYITVNDLDRGIDLAGNLTVEDDAIVDQDLTEDATVQFAGIHVPDGGFIGVNGGVGWTYDDTNGDITTSVNVGIGTTAPGAGYSLDVVSKGAYAVQGFRAYSTNVAHHGALNFLKSHANTETLVATINGDVLGGLNFFGVDSGGGWDRGAQIIAVQQGAAGAYLEADLIFKTCTTTALNSSHLYLDGGTGYVGCGVVPTSQLDIGAGALELAEMTAPGAGAANSCRLYLVDVGGKTTLYAIFATGAAQLVVQQP